MTLESRSNNETQEWVATQDGPHDDAEMEELFRQFLTDAETEGLTRLLQNTPELNQASDQSEYDNFYPHVSPQSADRSQGTCNMIQANVNKMVKNPVEDILEENKIELDGETNTNRSFSVQVSSPIIGSGLVSIQTTQTVTVKKNMVMSIKDLERIDEMDIFTKQYDDFINSL